MRNTYWPSRSVVAVSLMMACGAGAYAKDIAKPAVRKSAAPTVLSSSGDAARFLEQSSFGPTVSSLAAVQELGIDAYLDQQLATAPTGYPKYPWVVANSGQRCPSELPANCYRDHYTPFKVQLQFYQNAVTGVDQLRQRVALAYSQIFVISASKVYLTYGVGDYEQLLLDDAFVNYRQLLKDITLSPAMGYYLDMVNNDGAASSGVKPNENYGREILQLFSIGTVMLNADGTPKLDANGAQIPTYDQEVVEGFAHVFTGWTWPTLPGAKKRWPNIANLRGPMAAVAAHHDAGAKPLLNGVTLPAGQSQSADLDAALDNIFYHPNVGPFIGKQLIQQLVTSNPSPAYVARITAVFNDNGSGVRGDLKAVIRAILLDPEARGDVKTASDYGKMRDPVLMMTGLMRGVGGASQTDGEYLNGINKRILEGIFRAPSVFNFYPPDYPLQGTSLVAPQFGIYNANTAISRANYINQLLVPGRVVKPDPTVHKATGTTIDLSDWLTAAGNSDPSVLTDQINGLLFHGAMSSTLRNTIIQVVNTIPVSSASNRAQAALYIAFTAPEYQLEQ